MKSKNGNRLQKTLSFAAHNMLNRRLLAKKVNIMRFLEENDPVLLAISEAEQWNNVDLQTVQIPVYDLLTTKALENPNLGVSRLVVYIKSSVNYEHLGNLESDEEATI